MGKKQDVYEKRYHSKKWIILSCSVPKSQNKHDTIDHITYLIVYRWSMNRDRANVIIPQTNKIITRETSVNDLPSESI